jgi:hypothetical protein
MKTEEFLLVVNGSSINRPFEPDTPLLDVLRHDVGLAGPRFGCGLRLCGVHGADRRPGTVVLQTCRYRRWIARSRPWRGCRPMAVTPVRRRS